MSEDFNPLEYRPTPIEVSKILPLELPQGSVDQLIAKLDKEISEAKTVKEVLGVLEVAGKFAVKLGAEVAAQSLADGALGNLGDVEELLGG